MQSQTSQESKPGLPLTLPREVWTTLDGPRRELYEKAQTIVDALDTDPVPVLAVCTRLGRSLTELHDAFGLLVSLDVVRFDSWGRVQLIAVPDEHVRIVRPDGQVRWLFVARPVEAPVVPHDELN